MFYSKSVTETFFDFGSMCLIVGIGKIILINKGDTP